ncbi:hypothetical protein ASZ78_002159 [Callipepla squamata]|uniref:G-protein coupled receptors family 1 profile domain-containing protein n=1 Tax=Callipepla squamata TaxID=9009 RepID=A0A226MZ97_CALSU|nr:hypothetical protein ASZ78_002159 [Callipepla squamata]
MLRVELRREHSGVEECGARLKGTELDMSGMASDHNSSSQEEYLPHYLQQEDPFASKLSREADIVAGFYLTVIGILSTLGNGYVIFMSSKRKKKLRPAEIMTVNLAVCDLGISVIVFSYVKIILKVKSSTKEVAHYDTRIQNSHILEMKLTKVAMLICAGFLVAWIPYAVVSVWSAFGQPDSVPIQFSVVPTLLAKSAAMYNPIIYQVIDCKFACCRSGELKTLQKKSSLKESR